jgi:hypothetical protein
MSRRGSADGEDDGNRPRVLSAADLTASPVTLGVVLAIWSLFGTAVAYALSEVREARNGLHRLEVAQEQMNGQLKSVEATVAGVKEVFNVRLQALQPQPQVPVANAPR